MLHRLQVRPVFVPGGASRRLFAAAAAAGGGGGGGASKPDYESYLSRRSRARKPSAIRKLYPLMQVPGMISLGGGLPNTSTLPLAGLSFKLKTGETVSLDAADVNESLQYSDTPGLSELRRRLTNMTTAEHRPPSPFSLAVTVGSQDGLTKAFDMLVDEGDSLLVDNPTYPGSLAYLDTLGCKLVGVDTDGKGLRADALRKVLDNWNEAKHGRRPRVLYTIPTGGNPTGCSQDEQRKREIYEVAADPRNNLIILEDDPYYYLQFQAPRTRSLMSMDVDGRVLRFDSFSKVLSPGMRLGFVAGPEALISRINLHSQATNLHPSGVSQAILLAWLKHYKYFDDASGLGAFEQHVAHVSSFYKGQRDAFVASANKHLEGLVEFNTPSAGMFVWMKLLGVDDATALIEQEAVKHKVLLLPGSTCVPGNPPSPYVRAAFSVASPEAMDTALSRLGALLRSRTKK